MMAYLVTMLAEADTRYVFVICYHCWRYFDATFGLNVFVFARARRALRRCSESGNELVDLA